MKPTIDNPTRAYFNNLPQMPIRERDRRWAEVRRWMAEQDIDCLLCVGNDLTFGLGMGNFRYLSNCAPRHGGFLIFPQKGEPIMYAEQYHMARPIHPCAIAHDWVKDCRTNSGIHEALDALLAEVSPLRKIGLVSGANTVQYQNMPFDVYNAIRERLKGVEIVDASKKIFDMRGVKSDDELVFLRRAGQIHNKVLMAKAEAACCGATEADVFAAMMHTMLVNGAESQGFNLLTSGPLSSPEYQHMLHGLDADMCPTMRVLESGDAIISESHVNYGGYMTAAEFTVCIGRPPKEYERLYYAMVEAMLAAMEKMKPGNTLGEAHDAELQVIRKYGLDILELGFHGHGLGSPEPPRLIMMNTYDELAPENKRVKASERETVFRKNMVFGINGDVFDSKWREDVGIMFGDCIAIGETGPELLVNTPRRLIIK